MTPAESLYEEMLLRWLTVKRDTPGLEGDTPEWPYEAFRSIDAYESYKDSRARVILDFHRSVPP